MDPFGRKQIGSVFKKRCTKSSFIVNENTPLKLVPSLILSLTIPQQASLYSMIRLEEIQHMFIDGKKISTNFGILSNPMGFGKTALIIALISNGVKPKKSPIYYKHGEHYHHTCIDINLIFVGNHVINQWKNEIKKFNPKLKIFVINDKPSLIKWYNMYLSDSLDFDIILIYNHYVNSFVFRNGEDPEHYTVNNSKMFVFNIIAHILRNQMVTRVIIDDMDTTHHSKLSGVIAARFSWVVSCTTNIFAINLCDDYKKVMDEKTAMVNNNFATRDIIDNNFLYMLFNIRVCDDFIKQYATIGIPTFYTVSVKHEKDNVIKLLLDMDLADNIMEAIHADEIEFAASISGIANNSLPDILQSLIQSRYNKTYKANNILDFIELTRKTLHKLPKSNHTYDTKLVESMYEIKFQYSNIEKLLNSVERKWQDIYNKSDKILLKVKDSLSQQVCQVCKINLIDDGDDNDELDDLLDELDLDISIENIPNKGFCVLPCCYQIIHASCIKSLNLVVYHDAIKGTCPFNRDHRINYKHITFISTEINIDKLQKLSCRDLPKKESKKFSTILNIINGDHINKQIWSPTLNGLMKSITNLPELIKVEKIIIFSNYYKNLENIRQFLFSKQNIVMTILNSDNNINDFRFGEINVLGINGIKYASSLNLPEADICIFTHVPYNMSLFSQQAGRILRPGRKTNPIFYILKYETEYL